MHTVLQCPCTRLAPAASARPAVTGPRPRLAWHAAPQRRACRAQAQRDQGAQTAVEDRTQPAKVSTSDQEPAERADSGASASTSQAPVARKGLAESLGLALGPISMSFGGDRQAGQQQSQQQAQAPEPSAAQGEGRGLAKEVAGAAGVSLGPISLSFGDDFAGSSSGGGGQRPGQQPETDAQEQARSIASLSTEEWRRQHEKDGCVDLWLEDEFNAGSRLVGGRAVHKGGTAGFQSGEGPSAGAAPVHAVKIFNRQLGQEIEVQVPQDRYVLFEAEEQGLTLPWACRMGCCTACAVRVLEGDMWQPQALGVSAELKERGFALMCVGYPLSNLVLETALEDEVYDIQFGKAFAQAATNPSSGSVLRDDFALELADMDE